MEFYLAGAALRPKPAEIDKDGAIGPVISVEVGSGKDPTEPRLDIQRRCEVHSR